MRTPSFLLLGFLIFFLDGMQLQSVYKGMSPPRQDLPMGPSPSFQKRIDSITPIVLQYHRLLQDKLRLLDDNRVRGVKSDSLQQALQNKKSLIDKLISVFITDTLQLRKQFQAESYPKAREFFEAGLISEYIRYSESDLKLNQFSLQFGAVHIQEDPNLLRVQKALFDQKQQHLRSLLLYVASAKGTRSEDLFSDSTYKQMLFVLEGYSELDRGLKFEQKLINENIRLLDSLSAISNPPPLVLRKGKSIFEEFLLPGTSVSLIRFRFNDKVYVLCLADATKDKIRIHSNTSGRLQSLRSTWNKLVKNEKRPYMLVNGGMYERDGSSVGLLISEGKKIKKLDMNTMPMADNFHMYPNGVFYIDNNGKAFVTRTYSFSQFTSGQVKKIGHATQSGPMLVYNDTIHASFRLASTSLNIRNAVGVIEGSGQKKVAFVVSENKVNFFELALVYKYILNCKNALYLDGSISKMFYRDRKENISYGDLKGDLGPVISVSGR